MDQPPSPPAHIRRRDPYGERLRKRRASLSPSLLTVADYIDGHRHAVLGKSALEIARETGTSDATVIRAIQMLGFDGLIDLKDTLEAYLGQTDSPSEKMAATTGTLVDDVDSCLDFVLEDQANALAALSSPDNRRNMAQAVSLLASARRIGVFGIGASGIIAAYAARLFLRSGYPSYTLDRTGILLAEQIIQMDGGDVLMMLLHARPHREAMAAIAEAERLSIPVIMIVGKEDTVLLKHAAAHIVIPRARSEHVALHAPTLCCVEALMLGLAGRDKNRTLATIDRLLDVRQQIRPSKR
ncbi:MurR/RpiR family transcriptional regulator [Rhizobiaceae bacterium BDR2-2]|uniref:MurR/RpiR family transcriptional regulator n=1 Tax=Ectorhizobium quercum TaxID=2965071 RepID=A0AAE3MY15_9HYPH|nr:MurR/RpiR family transcriptional regulator [Ectorhizobium quercum]MCX8995537.1 MurR/RpiR family transcriptional regulator [Ectorhizobium quercum]